MLFKPKKQIQLIYLKAFIIGAVFIFAGFILNVVFAQADEFFVESVYDVQARSQLTANLKKTSEYVYFFVEDRWFNNLGSTDQQRVLSSLNNLASEFDRTIYPRETKIFGTEWNPGIDGDARIIVLVTEMIQAPGGYFNPNDEYLRSQMSRSNQREMVYLNALYINDSKAPAFLAHEFQHLITFNQKNRLRQVNEEVWLNEARSEYAITLCGYNEVYEGSNLARRVEHFLAQPSDSLTHWQNDAYDYGSVSLFMHYLVEHYGEEVLTRMMQTDKIGIESVDEALVSLGYVERFADIFSQWLVANLINNCDAGLAGQYCYFDPNLNYNNLHIEFAAADGPAVPSVQISRLAQAWAGNWHRFSAKPQISAKYLTVRFDALDAQFQVFYVITDKQGRQKVEKFGLNNGQGVINVNNFGTNIVQLDVLIAFEPSNSSGSALSLRLFNLNAASQQGEFSSLSDGLLALASDGRVYLINNGQKHWISSAAIFESRFSWSEIKPITDEALFFYQEGELISSFAEGVLLKMIYQDRVYLISGGRRRWIFDAATFEKLGYSWENIVVVSENDLNYHSIGQTIVEANLHPEGSLIKGSSAAVYYVQNNKLRQILSLEAFERAGFHWERLLLVSDEELARYELGKPII